MTYARNASGSNARYTPPWVVSTARSALTAATGQVTWDFDPASCEAANEVVRATKYLDGAEKGDGYAAAWYGHVWVNPPYGKHEAYPLSAWVQKTCKEYHGEGVSSAMLLVPAFTAQKWFRPLWTYPIAFFSERLKFIDGATMQELASPMYAHCLVWLPPKGVLGAKVHRALREAFGDRAHVVVP